MAQDTAPNYWDYLKLDRLLRLQGGLADDEAAVSPDELHFIVVHQTYELWFKLVLRELRMARDRLGGTFVAEEEIPHVVHHLNRVNEILKLAGDQFRVMETLSPQEFLAFRDELVPASGFQSFQMREMELILGLSDEQRVTVGGADSLAALRAQTGGGWAWDRIGAAQEESTLASALHEWLYRTPIRGSGPAREGDKETVLGFVTDYLAAHERHQQALARRMADTLGDGPEVLAARFAEETASARRFLRAEAVPEEERPRALRIRAAVLFIESYRHLPLLAWPRALLAKVVEVEQSLLLWRNRHARMVERMIGRRTGTGGSSGVDYLDRTARFRIFTDLWEVRTLLLPRAALPPLANAAVYGFAF